MDKIAEIEARVAALEARTKPAKPAPSVIDAGEVRRLRGLADMSQRDLAGYLGVTGSAVHGMEHGTIGVDAARAKKIRRIVARAIRKMERNGEPLTAEQRAFAAAEGV